MRTFRSSVICFKAFKAVATVFGATVTVGRSEPEGFRLESGTSEDVK